MLFPIRRKAMDKRVLTYSLFLLFGVFISAVSQVLLKKAAQKRYKNIVEEYMNPLVIFAYAMFFGATLLSIVAYKAIPLSMGPVLESTSYFYVTVFGAVFFKERINRKKITALLVIFFGIFIYSFFG